VWENADTGSDCYARAATIATRTPTFGAEVEIDGTNNSGKASDIAEIDTNKFVVAHVGTDSDLYAEVCTLSGNTITEGADTEIVDAITIQADSVRVQKVDTDKFIVFYDSAASTPYCVVCTVSGTTITAGTPVALPSGMWGGVYTNPSYVEAGKVFFSMYNQQGITATPYMILEAYIAQVTGTVPVFNQLLSFNGFNGVMPESAALTATPVGTAILNDYQYQVMLSETTDWDIFTINVGDNNFIGFSAETIATGNPCTVNLFKDNNQSGLTAGAVYYLGANGVISLTGEVEAGKAISATEILVR
jgi:hypothetical protein